MNIGPVVPYDTPESLLREWLYQGQEVISPGTGKKATVLSFEKKYLQRSGFDHKRAGVYFDFNRVRIVEKSRHEHVWNAWGLFSDDQWPTQATCEKMDNLFVRLGDLPDTPFWVGDTVSAGGADCEARSGHYIVKSICYDVEPDDRNRYVLDGSHIEGKDYNPKCKTSSLRRVSRGNIWKLEHGKPLSFPGATEEKRLLEEAAFYKSLGMSHKVIFTDTESELWPIGGGLRELREGRADRLIIKNAQVTLIKYDDVGFGNRMRAAEFKRLEINARYI